MVSIMGEVSPDTKFNLTDIGLEFLDMYNCKPEQYLRELVSDGE